MIDALSPEAFATRYDLDLNITERAYENLRNHSVMLLGVSGKLGAGKDSAAPLIVNDLGYSSAIHEFFAKHLKDEVTAAMELISQASSAEEAAALIAFHQNVSDEKSLLIARRLWNDVHESQIKSSYTRTADTRFALQYWGTEIRREQDLNYWIKRAIGSAIEKLADGVAAYVTDARFENEIDAIHHLGGYTVRLKVSPEVQRERIMARDGIAPTPEALSHVSETSLDGYEAQGNFTVVIDTDAMALDEVVAKAISHIRS